VWGVYRTAQKADTIIDATNIPVGTRVFASIKNANVGATDPLLLRPADLIDLVDECGAW
jgi:hypothetical protein